MDDKDEHVAWIADPRTRAREIVRDTSSGRGDTREGIIPEQADELVHKLRVQQAELELQNERLRRIQAELNAERIRFTNLFNRAPAGYLTLNENDLILEANLAACTILGLPRDDLIEQALTRFIVSKDQDAFSLFRGKLSQSSGSRSCELRMHRPDGAPFWVQLDAVLAPEVSGPGTDVLLLISDITRRKQVEEENLRIKTLLETAGHLANFGGWRVNLGENRVIFCAQTARIHGMPADFSPTVEETFGFYPPEWREKIAAVFHNCATKGEPFDEEMQITPCQGERIWIRTTGRAVRDETGRIWLVEGAFQDITERKTFEQMLRASAREKEVLLREVHHRVKNNLAVIASLVDLHQPSVAGPAATTNLQELGTRIKSIALVHEQLYRQKKPARIDFQDYLQTLLNDLRLCLGSDADISCMAEAHGVELGLDVAIPCGLIVNELMTNALKYAFPDGRTHDGRSSPAIRVVVEEDNGLRRLVVSDNGVGFPPEIDLRTSKSFGLHMVRMLGTHQLRGRLDLEQDKGTSISLSFEYPK